MGVHKQRMPEGFYHARAMEMSIWLCHNMRMQQSGKLRAPKQTPAKCKEYHAMHTA